MKASKKLQRKASKMMPSEVLDSIFISKAKGSHIWDVDGNEYIDYKLGYGPVILGHAHPAVRKKVHEYDQKGISYGFDNALEVTVAEKIKSLVPSAERIRYFVSGTEATMHALRIARAKTKKEKILKFEGHYHGAHDYVLFSVEPGKDSRQGKKPDARGIPKALNNLVMVENWNDFDGIEKTVKKNGKDLAAIIAEPIMANASVIPPLKGYLKFLRELCDKHDMLLIFDEIKTGFRVSEGGAQELFGVKPHLSTFAKALGNGYPVSAVVGLSEIMDKYATKDVIPGSTYARNPVSLAATDATLDEIRKGRVHPKIERFGSALIRGIRDILEDKNIDAIVQGYPSIFQILFTDQEKVDNYRDFVKCNNKPFSELRKNLLAKGIMTDRGMSEPLYTCASHNTDDLNQTLEALESGLDAGKRTPRRRK
jgi:glutamate-1-semialdehyde 2,1-aminomutase